MPLYLRKLTVQTFAPDRANPREVEHAWKVVAFCAGNDARSCALLADIAAIDGQFRQAAIVGLLKLIEVAAQGLRLESAYDKKRCHECHQFRHAGKMHKIFRIRAGDTRIVFLYGPGREICICKILAKKKDNFAHGELVEFERLAAMYLDGLAAENAKVIYVSGED